MQKGGLPMGPAHLMGTGSSRSVMKESFWGQVSQ
jgi:hypothetical protein